MPGSSGNRKSQRIILSIQCQARCECRRRLVTETIIGIAALVSFDLRGNFSSFSVLAIRRCGRTDDRVLRGFASLCCSRDLSGETVLPLRNGVKLATDYRCQKFRGISRFFPGTIPKREPDVIPSVEFRVALIVLLISEWEVKFQRE